MLKEYALLTQELTILVKEDREGFQRIITGLEELTIYGKDHFDCGYGKYCNRDCIKASERADEMSVVLRTEEFAIEGLTPMEDILWYVYPGEPLDDDQQEFLALCKQIYQKETTHA